MSGMTGRRARYGMAAAGLVLAATGAAAIASQTHPSEARFLDAVREYDWWVSRIPDATLIAEGRHACRWLADQPPVSSPAPDRTPYEVFSRFIEGVDPTADWKYGSGRGLRGSVTSDAWNHLCPGLLESRTWEPSYPEDD